MTDFSSSVSYCRLLLYCICMLRQENVTKFDSQNHTGFMCVRSLTLKGDRKEFKYTWREGKNTGWLRWSQVKWRWESTRSQTYTGEKRASSFLLICWLNRQKKNKTQNPGSRYYLNEHTDVGADRQLTKLWSAPPGWVFASQSLLRCCWLRDLWGTCQLQHLQPPSSPLM